MILADEDKETMEQELASHQIDLLGSRVVFRCTEDIFQKVGGGGGGGERGKEGACTPATAHVLLAYCDEHVIIRFVHL